MRAKPAKDGPYEAGEPSLRSRPLERILKAS